MSTKDMAEADGYRWMGAEELAPVRSLTAFLDDRIQRFADQALLEFIDLDRRLTYAEFGALVDDCARALRWLGVGDGTYVGVSLPNVPEFPALHFAAARLGAILVAMNPRYTAPEIDHLVDDARVEALVVDGEHLSGFEASEAFERLGPERLLVRGGADSHPDIRSLASVIAETAHLDPPPVVDRGEGDLVGLQYTSGTTGLPKGCQMTHEYWLVLAQSIGSILGPANRVLAEVPYFYMEGQTWLLAAMWDGGSVVIPRGPSLRRYRDWLRDFEIDFCWFPRPLLADPPDPADRELALSRVFVDGMSPAQVAEVEERFGVLARDCYAMTEIGIGTVVPWEDREMAAKGSIGIPGPFRECRVVDEELNEVGSGVVGEICVRGQGLFSGYHNRPEVNADSFFDGGWFRTGDLGETDEAGTFYFRGRVKDMVRRSGENIAAREVEMVLEQMPGVAQAAVVPVPDDFRGEEVKAYLVLAGDANPDTVGPKDVLAWCRERLAGFKLPRYLEYREELPLTPSSKPAKRVLLAEKDDLRQGSFDCVENRWS